MTSGTVGDFSVVGEPRWVRHGRRHHLRIGPGQRTALAVAISWLPLLASSLLEPGSRSSFAHDLQLHAQLLVSIPTLILVERLIGSRLQDSARQFVTSGLVSREQVPELGRLGEQVVRLRDARLVPIILLVLAVALSFIHRPPAPQWRSDGFSRLWYLTVSAPVFRFLLLRWMWWIALWGMFVVRVSRLQLRIPATHPDGRGGLAFLSYNLTSFSWISFAIAAPVVATAYQKGNVGLGPEGMPAYLSPLCVVAAVVVLIVFGPLVAYSSQLRPLMRRDALEFSALATRQSQDFHARWFGQPEDLSFLTTPDFSAVNDLQETFNRSEDNLWLPIKVRSALLVAAGAFLPAIPFLLFDHALLSAGLKVLHALR